MCANDVQCNTAADDVWDSDSDHEQPARSPTRGTQLDREWEARKQQFYNAGFREGLDEGKEVTLQQGFNAGFAEGAQAGYEFGLVKSSLQVLTAHLAKDDSRQAKVQELLQQVSGLSNRTVMIDTCKALLAQQPIDVISQHLQAALSLTDADDSDTGAEQSAEASSSNSTEQTASSQTTGAAAATTAAAAAAAAAGHSSGSNSHAAAGDLPLPLQLVSHLKQELQQLGFVIGGAPPLTVARSSPAAQGAGQVSSSPAAAAADMAGVGPN